MADLVLWPRASFGIKPYMVIKNGFIVWAAMGDGNGSLGLAEPMIQKRMWGALGAAPQQLGVNFVSKLAAEAGVGAKLGLGKRMVPIKNVRKLRKSDMVRNSAMPHVEVDPQTFEVRADGKLLMCPPAVESSTVAEVYAAMTAKRAGAGGRIAAARVGIGGPVGSGKTALVERLIPALLSRGVEIAIVTNDLVTAEDAERIRRSGLIDPARVAAVEAGACPHTVIREDPTLNIEAADDLERRFPGVELILIESGGDNLASTFSRDLTDFWMFVIDVGGGDDIPRKRGPGVDPLRPARHQQDGPRALMSGSTSSSWSSRRSRCAPTGRSCSPIAARARGSDAVVSMIEREVLFRA